MQHAESARRRRRRDTLLWAAGRLDRALSESSRDPSDRFATQVEHLLRHHQQIASAWRRVCLAEGRGWSTAALSERQSLANLLESSSHHAADALAAYQSLSQRLTPALRMPGILDELRQLEDEFGGVRIDRRNAIIAVVTEPVELDDVHLGRFRIELHMDRLRGRPDGTVLTCVALDPNPAASSPDTTHPHVQCGTLCAGEATAPLQAALRHGRLCDVFMLVNAVLHTYNASSPYVSLEDWHGVSCADCGNTTDEDYLCRCNACEIRVCDDCISTCEGCDCNVCASCVEHVESGGESQYLCPSCRAICPQCERIAPNDDVDKLGVCRECHEEEQQHELEDQENEDHEPITNSNDASGEGSNLVDDHARGQEVAFGDRPGEILVAEAETSSLPAA